MRVRVRVLATAAAVWVVAVVAGYLALIAGQGSGGPAWWYVGLLLLAAASLAAAAVGRGPAWSLPAAIVLLWLGAAVAALTIGAFLVPAIVLAVVALVLRWRGANRAERPG